MKRYLVIGLFSALVLYVIPLMLLYVFQRNFMYFPPKSYLSPTAVGLENVSEISLPREDGSSVLGWWSPPPNKSATVVMFFHGNASAVYSNYDIYRDLIEQGLGVYAVGYSGYPGSSGDVTQSAIVEGAILQYDWIVGQGIPPEQIVFYGTSLGSGIAAQLALERRPAKLILEAPFNSTLDMARLSMPIFPVKWLMKDQFRTDLALEQFDMPLLWLHGTEDEVIPLSQGRKLFEAYRGVKSELVVDGGRHTNLWALGGREFVLETLLP